jgi:hypothetical protein
MKKLLLSLLAVSLYTVMYAQLGSKPLLLLLDFENATNIAHNSQGITVDSATAGFNESGKFGGGASFDGLQFIVMDPYDTLNCTSSFTWAFWFKTTEEAGSLAQWGHYSGTPAKPNGEVEDEDTGNDPHWPGDVTLWLGWVPGGISYDVGYVGMANVGGDNPVLVNNGEWHHFAISVEVSDPTTESFYIDGALVSTAEVGAGFIDAEDAVYQIKVGYSSSSWPTNGDEDTQYPYYKGMMDEFRIYGAALNALEVLELFALEPTPSAIGLLDNEKDFSVFPNPATDYIRINSTTSRDIELFNSVGQLVFSQKNLNNGSIINVSGFDKGLYMLKSGDYTKKLMIE